MNAPMRQERCRKNALDVQGAAAHGADLVCSVGRVHNRSAAIQHRANGAAELVVTVASGRLPMGQARNVFALRSMVPK